MHCSFRDITERIQEPPLWWDEHGIPRWCKFHPGEVSNIYARTIAFFEIACQYCGQRFDVVRTGDSLHPMSIDLDLHYGDPPRHNCTGAGDTMNCLDLRVIEAWEWCLFDWIRRPELEIALSDINV
jgi:hypothetical protein